MNGGRLAARAYLDGNISLFEKYWREKYGSELILASQIKKIFYSNFTLRSMFRIARHSNTLKKIMGDIISCGREYVPLFSLIPFAFPKIVLEVVSKKLKIF